MIIFVASVVFWIVSLLILSTDKNFRSGQLGQCMFGKTFIFFGNTIVPTHNKLRQTEFLERCYVQKLIDGYSFSNYPWMQTSLTEVQLSQLEEKKSKN